MTRTLATSLALLLGAAITPAAQAAPLPTTVTYVGTAAYIGDIAVLTDGVLPDFQQFFQDDSVSTDFGTTDPFAFNFDFGSAKTIADVLFSVDNNDDYAIEFFNGATSVGTLGVIAAQGNSGFGFDTFATFAPVPNSGVGALPLAFVPLTATSAIIRGTSGDGAFAIGEVQFFAAAVPEPATWAMMIGGISVAAGALRRRRAPGLRTA